MHHGTDAAGDAARQLTAHGSRSVRASHLPRVAVGLLLTIALAGQATAATVRYEYDALGRLTRIDSSDGTRVIYGLDAAGNRTQVTSGTPAGVPASITVPWSSTSGSYMITWGASTGTVTSYQLYEATNPSFSGQQRLEYGTGRSALILGRGSGIYYYRVRACFDNECSAYRTGSNGVTVTLTAPPGIQVLNPSIHVGASGQLTSITALANLNGHSATIHSFSENCPLAGAAIESGAQAVRWTNSNFYLADCEPGNDQQCSASYVIRNSGTGQLHSGTASITVLAQGQSLQPGQYCP